MIRKAQFAGSWYPADPHSLKALIDQSIAPLVRSVRPYRFAVLPHAGLFYSKDGIAPFFAADLSSVEQALIIAPSHYANLAPNIVASAPLSACETPIGTLKVQNLRFADPRFFSAVQSEHALEMVLPYLANLGAAPAVSLALVSHTTDAANVFSIAAMLIEEVGLARLKEGEVVVIASSDFTHYGPRFGYTPYQSDVHRRVKEDDLTLSTMLSEGKIEEAHAFCSAHGHTVCGCSASLIVAAMAHFLGSTGQVASYYTSADVAHSTDANFVAYSTILWS